MLIEFKSSAIKIFELKSGSVVIESGMNEIGQEFVKDLTNNDTFKMLQDAGLIVIQQSDEPESEPEPKRKFKKLVETD